MSQQKEYFVHLHGTVSEWMGKAVIIVPVRLTDHYIPEYRVHASPLPADCFFSRYSFGVIWNLDLNTVEKYAAEEKPTL